MKKIPIAVQLYSVRDDCARDLSKTLKRIAEMGYDGVEFAGYHGCSAKDLRKMLDDLNLKVAGTHIAINTLFEDELEKTVEFNNILGNVFLIVPGLPEEYTNSIEAWKQTAKMFNKIADRLTRYNMFAGCHNHSQELTPIEGQVPWEVFLNTTSDIVVIQPDIGNALANGTDIVPYIEKYPGRARTVHLKEYSENNEKALVGEGDVDWPRVFSVCESVSGTEWYIVEQEKYACEPMKCIELCLLNLRNMGK